MTQIFFLTFHSFSSYPLYNICSIKFKSNIPFLDSNRHIKIHQITTYKIRQNHHPLIDHIQAQLSNTHREDIRTRNTHQTKPYNYRDIFEKQNSIDFRQISDYTRTHTSPLHLAEKKEPPLGKQSGANVTVKANTCWPPCRRAPWNIYIMRRRGRVKGASEKEVLLW